MALTVWKSSKDNNPTEYTTYLHVTLQAYLFKCPFVIFAETMYLGYVIYGEATWLDGHLLSSAQLPTKQIITLLHNTLAEGHCCAMIKGMPTPAVNSVSTTTARPGLFQPWRQVGDLSNSTCSYPTLLWSYDSHQVWLVACLYSSAAQHCTNYHCIDVATEHDPTYYPRIGPHWLHEAVWVLHDTEVLADQTQPSAAPESAESEMSHQPLVCASG